MYNTPHIFLIFFSTSLDLTDKAKVIEVVKGCLGTKFLGTWSDMACQMAIDAVDTVKDLKGLGIDLKNFAKIEKVMVYLSSDYLFLSKLVCLFVLVL